MRILGVAIAPLLLVALLAPSVAASSSPPESPRNLRMWANELGGVTLAWEEPGSTGSAPLSHYRVERWSATSGWGVLGTVDDLIYVDATPEPTAPLLAGYQVIAVNEHGQESGTFRLALLKNPSGPDCWISEASLLPPAVQFNGTCAILHVTHFLPEPYRTQARNILLPVWAMAVEEIRKIVPENFQQQTFGVGP
jgi:hypothetical protein